MEIEARQEFYKIRAIDRALGIPSVGYFWDKSTKVYTRLKATNVLVQWALDTVENAVGAVLVRSLPLARLVERPISDLDQSLCHGLDFIRATLPVIKEKPKVVLECTRSLVTRRCIRPAFETIMDLKEETRQRVKIIRLHAYYKVHYLRVYSWRQADRVMSTGAGINILRSVDNTAFLAESMLDKYLPGSEEEGEEEEEEEEEEDAIEENEEKKKKNYSAEEDDCCEHDRLHHTVIRLSEFGSRATRRIYFALVDPFRHMYKIEILIVLINVLVVIRLIKILEIPFNFILKLVNDCFAAYSDQQ